MIALMIFSLTALSSIIYVYTTKLDPPVVPFLIAALIFGFIFLYVLLFELRTKALKIRIDSGSLSIKNFVGFGVENSYHLNDFEGYVTSIIKTKYNAYEYLFLVKGRKRVNVGSEYYHKNYLEIKTVISNHLKFLGNEKYGFKRVVQDLFNR